MIDLGHKTKLELAGSRDIKDDGNEMIETTLIKIIN